VTESPEPAPDVNAVAEPELDDLIAAEAAYVPFPAFNDWTGRLDRLDAWNQARERLDDAREGAAPADLKAAFDFVMRAAAIDTGAIEDLYEVDRGLTYTVAAHAAHRSVTYSTPNSRPTNSFLTPRPTTSPSWKLRFGVCTKSSDLCAR
jgi:hypothetical protein